MSLDITRQKLQELEMESQIEKVSKELYLEHNALLQKEKENSTLRKRYRHVLNKIQDGIALIAPDHSIFLVNDTLNLYFQHIFQNHSYPGMDYREFVLPELEELYHAAFLAGTKGESTHVHRRLQSDTYDFYLEFIMTPLTDEDDNYVGNILVVQDRTDKFHEQERIQNQLAIFKDLSFITSHELRHEYAKLHSLVDMLNHSNELNDELRWVLKSTDEIFNKLNEGIYKLNQKISFSQAETFGVKINPELVKQVILIDDDFLTNMLHTRLLQQFNPNLELMAFESAELALKSLREMESSQHCLILLDLNMPKMDGWQFLDGLSKYNIQSQVAIVSSSIDLEDRLKARQFRHVREFITKPVNTKILEKILL